MRQLPALHHPVYPWLLFQISNLSGKEPQSVVFGEEMIAFQEYSLHFRSIEL
jgi:hypothetical protein